MRRLYKLILIILLCTILTFIIYKTTKINDVNILALGDATSSGENAYNIDGYSFNDYLKDYYESNNNLKNYNHDFSKKNYKLETLINDIKDNKRVDKLYLKQLIHNADIITIAIGMDEIAKYTLADKLTKDDIDYYISEYDDLIYMLRDLNDKEIVIISLYKALNFEDSNVIMINSSLKNIADKYQAHFINISDLAKNKDYYLRDDSFYLNYKAQQEIYEMILCTINAC